MARDPAKPAVPVLYLLDEFAALGHLAPVERAMGLMAGYGVQLGVGTRSVQNPALRSNGP
jgi:type IV secretion system protein VirD4